AYESGGWDQSLPAFHKEAPVLGISRAEDQREAISYAAYRVLYQRYKDSIGADYTLFAIDWLMNDLGFDPAIDTTVGDSPAAVGNRIAAAVIAEALNDGSNEANDYADTSGYTASNAPLKLNESGTDLAEPNLWQPLAFDFRITQNGIEVGESVQEFIGVNWREVDTFAIEKDSSNTIAIDPGPPPLLDTSTQQEFLDAAVEVIRYSSFLDPNKNVEINVSPGGRLNNRLGENEGSGRSLNPVTGEKYADNWVNQADYGRILAEFWADGPASETPPGHWNTLHNEIAEDPLFERRYGGVGEELPQLEWDIQAYLALNGAMHDAAIAAWTLKRQYDYVRPISIIRHLGELGQSTDSDHSSYHPQGLPLTEDLVEIITAESAAAGQRHAHLSDYIGEIAIYCWAGEPTNPETEVGGVDWIRAVDWLPYQRDTFVTPAFAAYVSGHSTFSRAAAEVMTLLTGSSYFPGGMGEFTFEKSEYLEFEDGPSEDVTLQWATYYDAADQAGISRLYGGIHVRADDFVGRNLGARVGFEAFLKAHHLRYGALAQTGIKDPHLSLGPQNLGDAALLEVELQSDNRSLPTSLVASPEEGIYFSTTTKGLEVDVTCIEVSNLTVWPDFETGQSATEATFEISGQSPKIIYLRHLGEDAGMTDTPSTAPKIELFSLDAQNNETPIADNTAWINAERASLLEVGAQYLGLAEIQHDSQNAGLIATLAPGAYLIRLTQTGAIPSSSQFDIHLLE
ncbi:MAG: vanadium-dependent haloperoxidase, partial [Verrucomicrobiota bacterium]